MQETLSGPAAPQPPLSIAYSPCPNDTFVFHAWAHGLLAGAPPLKVRLADIDITNGLAEQGTMDLLKISYAALPYVLEEYALLPCGGAIGRGCGPLVLVKDDIGPRGLAGRRVAVPGTRSTAYLLFRLWAAQAVSSEPVGGPGGLAEVVVLPFHEIMPAVRDGVVDAGLVIHEARFTYQDYGLLCLADLGEFWEKETGLPIPLGAIVARRGLGTRTLGALAEAARASVQYAWSDPEASRDYVLEHAQELAPAVVRQHIGLYVNEHTRDIGDEGYAAVRTLFQRAGAAGLIPSVDPGALAFPAVGG